MFCVIVALSLASGKKFAKILKTLYGCGETLESPKRRSRAIGEDDRNPIESNVKNALFGWNDVKSAREGSRLYVFLNDTTSNVSAGAKQACAAYGTVPVSWSEIGRFAGELAA